ncbi:hypothetical protein BHE74_00038277 [Ensete ventricosum]|nr:hypothetical protein BHE74_00038277 [Ensete ventricosum]
MDQVNTFDPYGINGKVNWRNIGSYSLAAEVSWLSVGKAQLEYAAEALKGYRMHSRKLVSACMLFLLFSVFLVQGHRPQLIFTSDNVQDELQNSMKDYVRASIGISEKGKLLVPKLLHCFAKAIVEDSLLVDWICRYLSPDQVTVVRDSTSQLKQRLLGARSFSVIPYDSRFRYLFLPDDKTSQKSLYHRLA